MPLAKYNPLFAYDQIMQRALPGRPVEVTDPDTGIPVEGLEALDGTPINKLVSNSQGFVQPFQVQDGPPLVRVKIGTVAYDLVDLSLTGEAAEAAKAAAAKSIATAAVQGDNLVITRENGEVINAGNVRGGPGVPGTAGPAGSGFVSNVAVDEDGRPYFAAGSNEVQLISDTDGRPYYHVI